ncbi:protein lines-like [Eriocheir sinensis]|uniref:protein lines-like n=1 Tax=Eriocheir sinensis TaxID=95602 RepID=UPI0021CA37C8|nr:protein lines-like [Eriocheir sinensis]
MAEPQHKRAKLPPSGEGGAGGRPGRLLPRRDLEIIHTRLTHKCLCSLQLPDILHTLAVCNECLANRPAARPGLLREETLLYTGMLTLFFEVSLRQQSRGVLCARISQVAAAGADNEAAVLDVLFTLLASPDAYVSYSSARALSALLLMLRGRAGEVVLERLVENLAASPRLVEVGHSVEVVRRVIEWKDADEHPLEVGEEGGPPPDCSLVRLAPAEAQGANEVKHLATRTLERRWFALVGRLTQLVNEFSAEREHVVVSFLALWESLISVKANLSVTDTKEFYSGLERLMPPLTRHTAAVVWRKVLDLYNEVLCYGSTLALQDVLAEEPCNLAHLLIRAVKDRRFLECVPCGGVGSGTGSGGEVAGSMAGPGPSSQGPSGGMDPGDRTVLHKVVLVVLKAIAVTVKETRCDSSSENSSRSGGSGSEDVDMAIIERSLREVVRKVDDFVKAKLPFHPEAPMAEWMVRLFADQDDWLVESMVCGLDIFTGLGLRIRQQPELHACVNPHTTFLVFLETVYLEHDVLLDLLVSNETCFLLYLLRYLKFIRRSWHEFASHCGRRLEEVMTVLIRLRFAIDRLVSKNLFPYNITPVLKLLQKCEELYEGGEH